MKKLMIAAAIVCAAAMTQAATVYWTCTNVKDAAGNAKSGIAYFLTTDMLSYTDAQGLAGKGAEAVIAALGSAYNYQGTDGAFGVAQADAVKNSALGLSDSSTYSAYLMIFDTTSVTDKSNFYLTATKTLNTFEGDDSNIANVKWNSQSTASQATGAWNAVAAPEPTSGLLLLLGVAGLALRRRRA